MHKTWILVADAHHAEIWSCNPRQELKIIKSVRPADLHHFDRDIGGDRPGRPFPAAGGQRAAIEPHLTPVDHEQALFVRNLVATLNMAASEDSFDQLAVIAPPKMLGALRECFGHPVGFKIIAEQAKDLMKSPKAEVEDHIRGLVGPQ